MIAAVRAEFRKFFTTRMWWILLAIAVAYVGGMGAVFAFLFDWSIAQTSTDPGSISLADYVDLAQTIYSMGVTFGYVFPVLVGALSVTGEFRHQTLTPTFLADPNRVRVLGAKLIAALPLGALYGVVTMGAVAGLGGGTMALVGWPTGLGEAATWGYLARGVLALTIWAMVGVGLGVLLKSQVAAIIVVLAFNTTIEPTLRTIPAFTGRTLGFLDYLPGAAGDAVVGKSMFLGMNVAMSEEAGGSAADLSGYTQLDWPMAVAVLVGYALVFAAIGYFTTWRRDVS
jgi:hypothetical protein